MEKGEMKVRFAGDDRWTDERSYTAQRGWNHKISRLMQESQYPALEMIGRAEAWRDLGMPVPERYRTAEASLSGIRFPDFTALEKIRLETIRGAMPHDSRYATLAARQSLGWYVPEGRILPLGDNRDNSKDGRSFGPVRLSKVLGKGAVKFWPWGRIGSIR
jgi:signal peptidase I